MVLFTVSGTLAFLAAIKEFPIPRRSKSLKTREGKPTPCDRDVLAEAVENEGDCPEDLEKRKDWEEYNDREYILVSYCYELQTSFPSLDDFFLAQVRRRFKHIDQKYRETDVHNYIQRVCVMKEIFRSELVRFISRYGRSFIGGNTPKVPKNLKSAILCRDEPSIKQVIWETDKGYWEITWSKK